MCGETEQVCISFPLFALMLVSGGGGYSHILAIRVCAAGRGMVFKPFTL